MTTAEMRLSADPGSRYYDRDLARRATVYLDGEKLNSCFEADEEHGWAKCVDLARHVVGGRLRVILRRGNIKFRFR